MITDSEELFKWSKSSANNSVLEYDSRPVWLSIITKISKLWQNVWIWLEELWYAIHFLLYYTRYIHTSSENGIINSPTASTQTNALMGSYMHQLAARCFHGRLSRLQARLYELLRIKFPIQTFTSYILWISPSRFFLDYFQDVWMSLMEESSKRREGSLQEDVV